jgi:ABC-type Zn uptake system ZnuABC Zn-binding protein ZnuA
MAYTSEEKQAAAARLAAIKEGLAEKGIKYYVSAAKAIDKTVNPKKLNNVMNGSNLHERSLLVLEVVAGIRELAAVA